MTDKEIESSRQRLSELTANCSDKQPELKITVELRKLAREVGASTFVVWIHPNSSTMKTSDADTPELIRNIQQALQTASMISMSKAANKNFIIALLATIIALGSAAATWFAVLK